jgi:hypothetical protein
VNDNLVSAKELRDLGLKIPDNIPDCATTPWHSITWKAEGDSTVDPSTNVLVMNLSFVFNEAFKWIEVPMFVQKKPEDQCS